MDTARNASLLIIPAIAGLLQGQRFAPGAAVQAAKSGHFAAQDADIQKRVNSVHALIWGNYIQREQGLLLTRLDMAGKPFYVRGLAQSPSLEDTSLDGGIYLDALVQRYAKTRKPGTASRARILFRGLIKNATVSPSRGLLARGTHPDGITYWGEPSVDQYTGAIFGLWRYYHSSLATAEEKAQVRAVFTAFLERLYRSNWTILDEQGRPVRFGDLGTLLPTRAERLLAFLAAAYDVTGNQRWIDLYNQEKRPRLAHCGNYGTYDSRVIPAWVQFQNAMALRILLDVVKEPGDLAVYREGATTAAVTCLPFLERYQKLVLPGGRLMNRAELTQAGLWGHRPLFDAVRNPYEAAETILLLGQAEHYQTALQAYRALMRGLDFTEFRYEGLVYPAEYIYWLAVNRGLLPYDTLLDVETRIDVPNGEAYRLLDEEVYGNRSRYGMSLR